MKRYVVCCLASALLPLLSIWLFFRVVPVIGPAVAPRSVFPAASSRPENTAKVANPTMSVRPTQQFAAPVRVHGSPLRIEVGQPSATAPAVSADVERVRTSALQSQPVTLPLRFEPNLGQAADGSLYLAKSSGYEIHFLADRAEVQTGIAPGSDRKVNPTHSALSLILEGAEKNAKIEPAVLLSGKSNYFLESDPRSWLTGLPNYGQLQYRQIYAGIDLAFYGNRGQLEYDFIVAPAADPGQINLRLPQAAQATIKESGDLQLKYYNAELQLLKPVVYQFSPQEAGGHHNIAASYRIVADARGPLVKFELGEYDHAKPLVIDPVLAFAEPAPGTQTIRGIQVDSTGNIYIAGLSTTNSSLEVTKVGPDGSTVIYTSTISTTSPQLDGFAIDSTGRAYVAAYAASGLPTTASAYQQTVSSGAHVYLATLDSSGILAYATYVAGSNTDYTEGLAADSTGKAYLFGETCSGDFPRTTGASLTSGCYQPFAVKIDPAQSGAASLVYSNILSQSNAYALEGSLDSANNLYVAVQVNGGTSLQPTAGAFTYQGYGGPYGVYVEKLDPTGATGYVAYLGPGSPLAIAAEGTGSVFVGGRTGAYDFPATPGAFNTNYAGGFVTKLSSDGTSLHYSTFLSGPTGSTSNVAVTSLAVAPGCASNCSVSFGGYTTTSDMPVVNPIQATHLSPANYEAAFLGQLNAPGSQALFLSYFGGAVSSALTNCADDSTCAPYVTTDASGNLYVAGLDYSSDFPLTSGSNSNYNYIAKISPTNAALALAIPKSVAFPNQQPVGISTAHVPPPNAYVNLDQIVLLRNLGSSPITLSGITFLGAEFTETNNCGGVVAAGGACQIQVQFDPLQAGPRTDTMTINSDAPNAPTTVPLSGTAFNTPVLQLSAGTLDFGSINVGSTSSGQTLTLTNAGNTTMQFYGFLMSGPYSETDNCPSLILVGASCTATVSFSPVTAGYIAGYISISSAGNTYLGSPTVSLTGTGTGVGTPGLLISPNGLSFPPTVVGQTSPVNNDFNVVLQNTGTAPMTLDSISVTGDFLVSSNGCGVAPFSLVPQQSCYLRLQFAPTQTGTRNGMLSVTSSLSTVPQTLSLTGVGVTTTQSLVLNTTSLTWPDQPVGTLSATYGENQNIQLNNFGNSPL